MLRIGLIGCGNVAEFGHLPAMIATPGLRLTSILDPSSERLESVASSFGGPNCFTKPKAFFQSEIDAVVVASSASAHLQNVLDATIYGKPVLCEKPLATTDDAALQMIAAALEAKVPLFTAFCYRFSPVAIQIKQWIQEGLIGEVRALRLIYNWHLHGKFDQDEKGAWRESPYWRGRMLEGGPLVDCGVHQIDLARWWTSSEIARFEGAAAWVESHEAPDHQWLHMEHQSGALTTIEVSYSYGHTAKEPRPIFTYELIGTGGVIRYDREGYVLEARTGNRTFRGQGASEKNFSGMYVEFERALRTGDHKGMPSGEDGRIAIRIARETTDAAIARHKRFEPERRAEA